MIYLFVHKKYRGANFSILFMAFSMQFPVLGYISRRMRKPSEGEAFRAPVQAFRLLGTAVSDKPSLFLKASTVQASVIEIPGESKPDYHRVDRVMRCPESVSVHGRVDVASHDIETEVLQKQVGIDVADRVVSDRYIRIAVLVYKLADGRRIVRSIVFGEITHITTQLQIQHLGYLEFDIQIAV